MGQRLGLDKFKLAIKATTTTMTLAAGSRITIGGQQYNNSSVLTLSTATSGFGGIDTGVLQAFKLYFVYAVASSGNMGLVASLNQGLTGPVGFNSWKMVGAFFTDVTPSIATAFHSLKPLISTDYVPVVNGGTSWTSTPTNMRFAVVGDDHVRLDGNILCSATPTGASLSFNLPSWAPIKGTKHLFGSPEGKEPVGTWMGANAGTLPFDGMCTLNNSGTGLVEFFHSFGSPNQVTITSPFTFGSTDGFNFSGHYYSTGFGPVDTGE